MKFPEGYLSQEALYCTVELREFYREDSEEWRSAHREAVLKKREEFRRRWNRSHVEQVNVISQI